MSRYKISNPKIDGHIEALYEDGKITSFHFFLNAPMTFKQWITLLNLIPQEEDKLVPTSLTVERIAETKTNEKIALFCRMYRKYVGVAYTVSASDSGKIKLLGISEELLNRYFGSENFLFKGKHSIGNLARYYNELRAEISAPAGKKYPNHYSRDYEKKLSSPELSEYWAHLRNLKMTPVKNIQGKIVDWK